MLENYAAHDGFSATALSNRLQAVQTKVDAKKQHRLPLLSDELHWVVPVQHDVKRRFSRTICQLIASQGENLLRLSSLWGHFLPHHLECNQIHYERFESISKSYLRAVFWRWYWKSRRNNDWHIQVARRRVSGHGNVSHANFWSRTRLVPKETKKNVKKDFRFPEIWLQPNLELNARYWYWFKYIRNACESVGWLPGNQLKHRVAYSGHHSWVWCRVI